MEKCCVFFELRAKVLNLKNYLDELFALKAYRSKKRTSFLTVCTARPVRVITKFSRINLCLHEMNFTINDR
jgi:hypothetical protein